MIKKFIVSKFTQKELLATKKIEAARINGILTNLEPIINDLTITDIEYILEYKKFLSSGSLTKEEEVPIVSVDYFQDPVLHFEKSDTYKGSKPGWVFKTGKYGLGYYIDTKFS